MNKIANCVSYMLLHFRHLPLVSMVIAVRSSVPYVFNIWLTAFVSFSTTFSFLVLLHIDDHFSDRQAGFSSGVCQPSHLKAEKTHGCATV